MYKEVKVSERMPEMGKKVVVFDVEGNAITYAATEYGWHMPSLPNNIALDYWLEKVEEPPIYKPDISQAVRISLHVQADYSPCQETAYQINAEPNPADYRVTKEMINDMLASAIQMNNQ